MNNGNLGLWRHSCFTKNELPDEEAKLWLPSKDEKCNNELLSLPIQTSDWVAVLYDDQWWPGNVDTIDNDHLIITFMKPVGVNKFIWPSIPVKDKILKLTRLEDPLIPINNRTFFLVTQ